jgi:uncharacterized protein (TIGR03435 family)
MHRTAAGGFVALALSAFAVLPLFAQSTRIADAQEPVFDAASIKPNTSLSGASTIGFEQGGRFVAVNMPTAALIQAAYATAAFPRPQVLGGPGWIDADRFDINAVTNRNPSPEQRQVMLRALLADRFKLAMHRETRALPVYNLLRASQGPKLDKLRVSDGACGALRAPGAPAASPEQLRPCMLAFGSGSLRVNGVTASQFATAGLTRVVDRPVLDRTGLGDTLYDWAIAWTPESPAQASAATDLPSSVFSAVREQLGLTLEPASSSVDVVVVDHVEKPTPN